MTAEKVKSGRGLAGADVDYWIQKEVTQVVVGHFGLQGLKSSNSTQLLKINSDGGKHHTDFAVEKC